MRQSRGWYRPHACEEAQTAETKPAACSPAQNYLVMPGLVPGIHDFGHGKEEIVDGRAKPGHDGDERETGMTRQVAARDGG
jgi:hypothetical protein